MPTSAAGNCNSGPGPNAAAMPDRRLNALQARRRGFTLIEMLVVVAIIGVLTTAVALTIRSDPRREAVADAQRLALLLEAAQIEAQAGRRQLAWSASPDGYGFWEAESNPDEERHWQPIADDAIFRARRLADGVHVGGIDIDGQPLSEGDMLIFRRNDPPLFRIVLTAGQEAPVRHFEVRGLPTGRVTVVHEEEGGKRGE